MKNSVLDLIGNTPLVRLRRLGGETGVRLWAKLEGFNPGGSVKDRVALAVIEDGEKRGQIQPGSTVVEPTSGNTGIGLALVCAVKGYRLVLTMPEDMTDERKRMLAAYGAELVLTPAPLGMLGAVEEAERLAGEHQDFFMPGQFMNPENPAVHRRTTAREIQRDLGRVPDAFVAGVGTGGTITGVGEVLREARPEIHIAAVEPAGSPILSGGDPGVHGITGIGAGFFSMVLNQSVFDEVIAVTDEDARETARALALQEGILAGISSGAAVYAALRVGERLAEGNDIVVLLPDRGERYLSTGVFERSLCQTECR